ncbi:MAG: YitT family protein, partial [Anaerolineales bacterium]|nr:YitT family protein [Anaerolineales bacterium]
SSARTATIITNHPQEVIAELLAQLHRGVSYWEVTGGYTGQKRYLVQTTVTRPQVGEVKQAVARIDPEAFVTIGVSHEAMGAGFSPIPANVQQ